jgi:hypothetical protein
VRLKDIDSSIGETQVRAIFARQDTDVVDYWDASGLVQFKTAYNRTMLEKITGMEQLTRNSRIDGSTQMHLRTFTAYNLTATSLEDVFMDVMRRARDT